jgi:glyoxylase-like metal-dependent hydrolase (beta-lactamase superfamily II)
MKEEMSKVQISEGNPLVVGFFEERTSSIHYIVADPDTRQCAIIDPVLDFDSNSGATATQSADRLLEYVKKEKFDLEWVLDTHPHADHFSAASYLKDKTGIPIAIGEKVADVQKIWKKIYNFDNAFASDGSQWDRLFRDGELFKLGNLDVEVVLTPGHTLASIMYVVGNAAFIHDTLFMPDGGTARTDFPGGSAKDLWSSIQRILKLPDDTRLFTGHDYRPGGREPLWESTVAQQRRENIHLVKAKTEDEYIVLRQKRDQELPLPKLMLQSLQVNLRGGRLPEPEANGTRYLKIPLNALGEPRWESSDR